MIARIVAVVLPLLLVAAVVALRLAPRVDLVIVNPGDQPAQVRVHGDAVGVPAHGALRLDDLPARGLRLEAPGAGALTPEAAAGSTWVWTVAPVTTWWEVSMGYGDMASVTSSTRPFSAPGALFALPDGFLSVVDAPLPTEARVKKGTTGAVLSGLWSGDYADRVAPRTVTLDVHNGSRATVRFEMAGASSVDLPPGSVLHMEGLRPQALPLRAVVVDAAGDGRAYAVDADLAPAPPLAPPPTYVWDVDGATRWFVESRRYGADVDAQPPAPAPRAFDAPGPFFRLPDGFLAEVDAPFPDTWHVAGVLDALRCQALHERAASEGVPAALQDAMQRRTPGQQPRQRKPRRSWSGSTPPPERATERESPFPPVDDEPRGE